MAKIDEKVKGEMAKMILQDILGKPVSIGLKVRTKKEIELDRLLTTWHNKANKRRFFIGDKKAKVPRG